MQHDVMMQLIYGNLKGTAASHHLAKKAFVICMRGNSSTHSNTYGITITCYVSRSVPGKGVLTANGCNFFTSLVTVILVLGPSILGDGVNCERT